MGKILGIGCLVVIIAGIGFALLVGKAAKNVQEKHEAEAAAADAAPVSSLVWGDVDAIYNLKYKSTDLQKNAEWPKYKGKKVKWTGTVSSVGETFGSLSLQVKMNAETFVSDLLIKLKDTEKDKALGFKKGDPITFIGVLEDWGSIMPITLTRGEIVSGK